MVILETKIVANYKKCDLLWNSIILYKICKSTIKLIFTNKNSWLNCLIIIQFMSDAIKFVLFYQGSLRNFSKVETLVIVLKKKLYKSRNFTCDFKKTSMGKWNNIILSWQVGHFEFNNGNSIKLIGVTFEIPIYWSMKL